MNFSRSHFYDQNQKAESVMPPSRSRIIGTAFRATLGPTIDGCGKPLQDLHELSRQLTVGSSASEGGIP